MQAKYFIIFLLLLNGVLIHQVLLPIYSGKGSAIYSSPGKGVSELKQEIKAYDSSLDKADEIIARAKALKKDYESVTEEKKELMRALVPNEVNENDVKLHSEIASILAANGFSTEELGVNKKTGATSISGIEAYTIGFTIKDPSYQRLKEFLALVERSKRIIAVKAIDVSPPAKAGEPYKFDVSAETYYIPK